MCRAAPIPAASGCRSGEAAGAGGGPGVPLHLPYCGSLPLLPDPLCQQPRAAGRCRSCPPSHGCSRLPPFTSCCLACCHHALLPCVICTLLSWLNITTVVLRSGYAGYSLLSTWPGQGNALSSIRLQALQLRQAGMCACCMLLTARGAAVRGLAYGPGHKVGMLECNALIGVSHRCCHTCDCYCY